MLQNRPASTNNCPSFGMVMQERSFSSPVYRYGFNGKEKNDEINVEGGDYDFGARIYDSRLGRWLSLDPLFKNYPSFSLYGFCINAPLSFKECDGKDFEIVINKGSNGENGTVTIKANYYTISKSDFENVSAATNQLNTQSGQVCLNGETYNVKFELTAVAPSNFKDNISVAERQENTIDARERGKSDPIGNIYYGNTGDKIDINDLNSSKFKGGETTLGRNIRMNCIYDGMENQYCLGDRAQLVSHEILHTLGLNDKDKGKYYCEDGRMSYIASTSNNYKMKDISKCDIAKVIQFGVDNDGKKPKSEDKNEPSVSIKGDSAPALQQCKNEIEVK